MPEDPSHRPSDAPRRRTRTHRRRRWILGGVGVVILVLLIIGGIAGFRFMKEARDVQAELQQAKVDLSQLTAAVKNNDEAGMKSTAAAVTADVRSAHDIVDGPLWGIAAHVPFVGQNVAAVQRVTRAVGILADQALQPGMQVMSSLKIDSLALTDGGLNLEPFRKAESSIPAITAAFEAAQSEIAPIDESSLMSAVSGPVTQITQMIDTATPSLQFAKKYLPTLLDIAGAHGKKTYLLLFQNNAEIRATGGNPGASMAVTMKNGHLTETGQSNTSTFRDAGTSGIDYTKLPQSTAKLYSDEFPLYFPNFTMTPDFPTTSTLFRNLWKHTTGTKFDGVISIDPVVLSEILAVTGPVKLPDGQSVTSKNAVKLLLSEAYEKYPKGTDSDAFFADVSTRVFNHLVSAHWDAVKMLDALSAAAKQQRIYLNFTDAKAQAVAVELGLDGALQSSTKQHTQLGMYLNDSSVGKLEYWLTTSVHAQCNVGARTITETMTLHNSIPDSIHSSYTLGARNHRFGIPRQTMILDVVSFAPPGATIVRTDPAVGQVPEWVRSGVEKGNPAVSRTVFVPQGKTVTVSYTVKLPKGELGPLDLRHTPTAHDTKVTIGSSCDQLFTDGK